MYVVDYAFARAIEYAGFSLCQFTKPADGEQLRMKRFVYSTLIIVALMVPAALGGQNTNRPRTGNGNMVRRGNQNVARRGNQNVVHRGNVNVARRGNSNTVRRRHRRNRNAE
jgi:hypothetical protein